jgi:hypothetical protein
MTGLTMRAALHQQSCHKREQMLRQQSPASYQFASHAVKVSYHRFGASVVGPLWAYFVEKLVLDRSVSC